MSFSEQITSVKERLSSQGVGAVQFASEFAYLLFLKFLHDTGRDKQEVPEEFRWSDLTKLDGTAQLDLYLKLLTELKRTPEGGAPNNCSSIAVRSFFQKAGSRIEQPKYLTKLVTVLDHCDWFELKDDPEFRCFFEALLEESENERSTDAQDFFTPRVLIRSILRIIKPQPGERIQDPACGVGGFLVEAAKQIHHDTEGLFSVPSKIQEFQKLHAFTGVEISPDKYPLLVLNCLINGIENSILFEDSLSSFGKGLSQADVILCNPPYAKFKRGEKVTRDDLNYSSNMRHLCFLQHFYRSLKPGGRAAVILPDNVLFEDRNNGHQIRQELMNKCNLHTILRLPEGLYPGKGVKINVLFFSRGHTDEGNTKSVWIYDMRTNLPAFGKRNPASDRDFAAFESCFGDSPAGTSTRIDQGIAGRFRCFSRQEITGRNDNLDITWLNPADAEELKSPDYYTEEILKALDVATGQMKALKALLG